MGCVNATLAKRRLNPTYLKLSEEEFIKLNHLIMITNLMPIDIMRIVQEFRKIDVDGSGTISAREFFHHYSCRDTQFARRAMTIMDDQPPGNMSLDLVEFCAALYNYCTYDRDTLLWFIFHLFDEDDSGTLEALEFKDLISFVYCRPLTPTVQALVEKHGVAPTGFISRDQFVKRCREAPLLVAPAFELQRALHETVLGTKFWREHAENRTGRTRADNEDVLLNEFRKMDKAYQPGGHLCYLGDELRKREVIDEEKRHADLLSGIDADLAGRKINYRKKQSLGGQIATVRFEGGKAVTSTKAQRSQRQMTILKKEKKAKLAKMKAEKLAEEAANADNAAWGGVLKDTPGDIERRETLVTYRPARKPGDGPNIRNDSATYSRLINMKKYAAFRKNMEKHEIHSKSGMRVGSRVDKKKVAPSMASMMSAAGAAHGRDSVIRKL